jgi:mannose-6-phosphate isomerase-like protein (cupin superfamily)
LVDTINLADKLRQFDEHWSPRIIGQVNDTHIKLVKVSGDFLWHRHDDEDELFFVLSGRLTMRFRDREAVVRPGELIIVPRGVEHQPSAPEETHLLLVEPATTLNTGNVTNERTVAAPEKL